MNREERILLSLSELQYMSTSQLYKLHDLKSVRNTSRVMKRLKPYTHSFMDSEKVYYLNAEGRRIIGCQKPLRKPKQVVHKLMRNDVYIHYKPYKWVLEAKVKVNGIEMVADARFEAGGNHYYLECDNMQLMKENEKKIERYRQLRDSGVYQKAHKTMTFPTIVWVTRSAVRAKKLRTLMNGMKSEIFLWEELK